MNVAVRWLREVWGRASASIRHAIIAFWIAGGILFGLGPIGDIAGIWSSLPFLTNMITALTSFCFAVPFAVLVLQELARQQANQSERRAALADARALAGRLDTQGRKLLSILTPQGDATELSRQEPVADLLNRALALLKAQPGDGLESQDEKDLAPVLKKLDLEIGSRWKGNFGGIMQVREEMEQFHTLCHHLDRGLRGRLLIQGINWPTTALLDRVERASEKLMQVNRPFLVGGQGGLPLDYHTPWIHRVSRCTSNYLEYRNYGLNPLQEALERGHEELMARYSLSQAIHALMERCNTLASNLPPS
jgi:hypothetical protein